MRTSPQQFEMLVTFMEQHGDISNPVNSAKGRINQLRLWEQLKALLNGDGSGDTKSAEKWKKVWSDYKSNTKKKAGRLLKAAGGTGGGPAISIKVTDLECRTLTIMGGIEAVTGLQVAEAGFSQEVQPPTIVKADSELAGAESMTVLAEVAGNVVSEDNGIWNEPGVPGPSGAQELRPISSPPPVIDIKAESTEMAEILDAADRQEERNHHRPSHRRRRRSSSPYVAVGGGIASVQPELPNLAGQTTPRRRATRGRTTTPRRMHARQTQRDQAAEHFVNSDAEWRQLRLQQHQDYMENTREANRIREMELETQRMWQQLGNRALDILEKFVDKYCEK